MTISNIRQYFTECEFGLGYNYAQSSYLVFTYENNVWVSKIDKSYVNHRFTPGLGAHLGYDLSRHWEGRVPLKVQVGYQLKVLTPFMKEVDQPIGAYHQWHFGVTYRLLD